MKNLYKVLGALILYNSGCNGIDRNQNIPNKILSLEDEIKEIIEHVKANPDDKKQQYAKRTLSPEEEKNIKKLAQLSGENGELLLAMAKAGTLNTYKKSFKVGDLEITVEYSDRDKEKIRSDDKINQYDVLRIMVKDKDGLSYMIFTDGGLDGFSNESGYDSFRVIGDVVTKYAEGKMPGNMKNRFQWKEEEAKNVRKNYRNLIRDTRKEIKANVRRKR